MTVTTGKLAGKVALVTGGARGLGLGITEIFLKQGAKVAMLGRTKSYGDSALQAAKQWGGEAIFVEADLAKPEDIQAAVEKTVSHFGALHLLVNNAAPTRLGGDNVVDIPLHLWDEYFAIGSTAPMLAAKFAIPHMLKSGYGSIVNISSNAAVRAIKNGAGYMACKAALHGLTLSIAYDFGPTVRCNELIIGHLHHSDHPMYVFMESDPEMKREIDGNYMVGRWGTPQDLGNACAFLCSEESGFVTAESLHVDGGSQRAMRFPDLARSRAFMKAVQENKAQNIEPS